MFAELIERVPRSWAPAQGFRDTMRAHATRAVEIADWLRRTRCGLAGHAMVLHFEPQRMSLRCMHCGEQTAGWSIQARR